MEQLYDPRGHRKYLTEPERNRFLKAARSTDTPVRAFCEVLAYTGCRLSEAFALTPERVDSAAGFLVRRGSSPRGRSASADPGWICTGSIRCSTHQDR